MTREEIKKWLENLKEDIGHPRHEALWHYEQALDEIIQAVTQKPKTREWIPCSERLPSERGWYLITVQGVNRFTDVDYYYGNSEWDEVSSKQKVIAWMPLPKPYREDGKK